MSWNKQEMPKCNFDSINQTLLKITLTSNKYYKQAT